MTAPLLLIVENDAAFARTLARSFERRGYEVIVTTDLAGVEDTLTRRDPALAVVDLNLGTESGLASVAALHRHDAATAIVVLTGYASIATTVEAIKLGATNYLAKPANTDEIIAAFAPSPGDADAPLATRPTSIKTLEWERIHQVLADTDYNISETARRLGMHRRTLARKLEKQRVP